MVAADALALAEKRESAARAKAAAWAWYQRSGGSVTPTAGRSEAFATRCATRHSASRFQREAASRLRMLAIAASFASTASDSALTSFSSIENTSTLSHECSASFGDATDPEDLSSNSDQVSNSDITSCLELSSADQENGLALTVLHPRACWDCGSTLFDSFELVAMSKRLDAELQNLNIDSDLGSQDDCNTVTSSSFGSGGLDQQQQLAVLPLIDTPFDSSSPTGSPPQPQLFDSDEAYDAIFDTRDKLASPPDVLSKQEVYNMFCQYSDASKHVTKSIGKQSPAEPTCADESKKQNVRSGRMSLHVLSKVLHNLRHPSSNPGSDTKARDHHHPLYSPHHHKAGSRSLSMHGIGGHIGASRLGEWLPARDDTVDKPQHHKARHIHHHHHHHYHYLFHSDDDFRLQPLDKSLMVAVAGLRSPKVNPAMASYRESPGRGDFAVDYSRKWSDLGTIPSPVGPNFEEGKTFS